MRLGVVSDTHDALPLCLVAADVFAREGCDLVLHLGDVTGAPAARAFLDLPVRFVRGNNDVGPALPRALAAAGARPLVDVWEQDLAGVRVAATHGHLRAHVARLPNEADLVLMGHSHKRIAQRIGRALVVNPGALTRCATRTCATIDLPRLDVTFWALEEDGAKRLPALP